MEEFIHQVVKAVQTERFPIQIGDSIESGEGLEPVTRVVQERPWAGILLNKRCQSM